MKYYDEGDKPIPVEAWVDESGELWFTAESIQAKAGVSRREFHKYSDELRKLGLLTSRTVDGIVVYRCLPMPNEAALRAGVDA